MTRAFTALVAALGLCAVAVPATAYLTTDADLTVDVSVATLATPTLTVGVEGTDAVVMPRAGAEGPAPASFDVLRIDPAAPGEPGTPVCTGLAPRQECRDRDAALPSEGPLTYVVVAHLGTRWTATSRAVGVSVMVATDPEPNTPVVDTTGAPAPGPTVGTPSASESPTASTDSLASPVPTTQMPSTSVTDHPESPQPTP